MPESPAGQGKAGKVHLLFTVPCTPVTLLSDTGAPGLPLESLESSGMPPQQKEHQAYFLLILKSFFSYYILLKRVGKNDIQMMPCF